MPSGAPVRVSVTVAQSTQPDGVRRRWSAGPGIENEHRCPGFASYLSILYTDVHKCVDKSFVLGDGDCHTRVPTPYWAGEAGP